MIYKKGHPGGPGMPKGSRNKLSEDFLKALYDDFTAHGKATIEAMRVNDPSGYVKTIAGLLPKDVRVTDCRLVEMTDAEILSQLKGILPEKWPGDEPKSVH